ncbi:transposase [Candidatus Gottesmanbacteria bacterium]|nr:transposase [Candidatus Gottesmanbacteria bacterium]
MPTHFHFTLQQTEDFGIYKFLHKISNSYAHYFNIKHETSGPLFEPNFEAVHVETDEQILHLSRYIHLNPVTAYLVDKPEDYSYSSYKHYIGLEKLDFVYPSIILDQFRSIKDYEKFVMARKDYQRDLAKIKHLIIE